MMNQTDNFSTSDVAIIGMAGRFPGANDVDTFWQNLRDGVESIRTFSDEELRETGVSEHLYQRPDYIRRRGELDTPDHFDANFFDFTPKEAEITDPQQRLFLECAWQALESAGYDAQRYEGLIGVYAGSSPNTYIRRLESIENVLKTVGDFQIDIGNEKDYLAPRVSYKLNLRGPSITVQTACSSSLASVHIGTQALLNGECDIVLAGGVSVQVPQRTGYLYREGSVASPDGRCRAFDAQAAGTVPGSGAGVVVLKRLAEAVADGDVIYAVIKGSAMNNDGADKVGFTAPSITGQSEVISEALALANISADTIHYVEAHGTGTVLGDPIEVQALTQAFATETTRKQYCGLGSVKTNIGHLDAAAGVAGLIKAVLALHHDELPPSLHFNEPNPAIDFANSPFIVNHALRPWPQTDTPKRAGVSSFGIGGTNVHVVLEEAPKRAATQGKRPFQLLLLSAKTESAVRQAATNLADYLEATPAADLADVAYTQMKGRRRFAHRRMVVCDDRGTAITALRRDNINQEYLYEKAQSQSVVFLFPGQGSQYVNMGADLYQTEATFRYWVDQCAELLRPHLQQDIRQLLYPATVDEATASETLKQTQFAQPALFTISYALAQLWLEWGVEPRGLLGHSLGEFVAACLADVFSLKDALKIVAARGRLMQTLPHGSMVAVSLPEAELVDLLPDALSLAAVNAPNLCVVSGQNEPIADFIQMLEQQGISHRQLQTSHAFHSEMMTPILADFKALMNTVPLHPPQMPILSNESGTWAANDEITTADYWCRQLRQPVRFAQAMATLAQEPTLLLLEVGPSTALSKLARRQLPAERIITTMRHPYDGQPDVACVLKAVGRLWLAGVNINTDGFYQQQQRQRLALPTYPFERQPYSLYKPSTNSSPSLPTKPDSNGSYHTVINEFQDHKVQAAPLFDEPTSEDNIIAHNIMMVWHDILGVTQIQYADDFFMLGGDSLTASQLVAHLRDLYGIALTVRHIFEHPSVEALAEHIENMLIEKLESLSEDELTAVMGD